MIDGKEVATRKDVKMAGQYSSVTGYGLLFGRNTGTPVSERYTAPFTFTGDLAKVTIKVGKKL
jgi:hypothetical protein